MDDQAGIGSLFGQFGDDAGLVAGNVVLVATSFAEAAAVLELPLGGLERQLLTAAQLFLGCPACRHSRAPYRAVPFARLHHALLLHQRACSRDLSEAGCPAFAPICPPWDRPMYPPEVRDE